MTDSTDTKLQEYQTKLATAYQELESFTYSVSHDLRAPLQHIAGFVGLLQQLVKTDTSIDKKAVRYIEVIQESTIKMTQMFDALLELSRLGRENIEKSSVDLADLIQTIQQEKASDIGSRNIEWKVQSPPEVSADPTLIKEALAQLIDNAIKFTQDKDSAQIEIKATHHQDQDIIISITDNGVGFDMKYVDKLFGVFQHLHNQEEFAGIGAGLAKVQKIVRLHGGRAWAEGSVNQGATFCFSLPKA